jgi:hypothetical protein
VGDIRLSLNNGRTTWVKRGECETIVVLESTDRDKAVTAGTLAMAPWDKKGLQACFLLEG